MKSLALVLTSLFVINVFAATSPFVAKIQRYYENNERELGVMVDEILTPKQLVGAAVTQYNKFLKAEKCKKYKEGCPVIYAVEAYGTNVIIIQSADSDGVLDVYIYSRDGRFITSGSATESSGMYWRN